MGGIGSGRRSGGGKKAMQKPAKNKHVHVNYNSKAFKATRARQKRQGII